MGEVEVLARGHVLFDLLPDLRDGTVGDEEHDDIALVGSLFDTEERLALDPAILLGAHPAGVRLRALTLTDNHLEAVVAHVERLTRALNAVTEDGDGLALENLLSLLKRELLAGRDVFCDGTELDLHFDLFLRLENDCDVLYHK